MTVFSYDWDSSFESKPDNDNYGYEIDDYIRKLTLCIRERMKIEHVWKVGATDGEHLPGECKIIYVGTKSSFPTAKQGAEAIATDEANRPYVCLADGVWSVRQIGLINANITVSAGITIDDVDISAHAAGTAKSQHTAGIGDHTHESTGAQCGKLNVAALNSYDSGWFAVALNTAYSKTHGLGALPKLVTIWFSENSNGNNAWLVVPGVNGGENTGIAIRAITTTTCSVEVANEKIVKFTGGGSSYSITSGYCRLILVI